MTSPSSSTRSALPAQGRIDIHSHLIPGVDDGCATFDESLACIKMLQDQGFVGTICTPHLATADYPLNNTSHVTGWVAVLQRQLRDAGVRYQLWPGGELRIFPDCVAWMKIHGIPRLAGSNAVLLDFWTPTWPRWVDTTFAWLIDQKCQPILAHPERLPCAADLDQRLRDAQQAGVWLQGNAKCVTGLEGPAAQEMFTKLLSEGRYNLLALDMHRPNTLPERLSGLATIEQMIGQSALTALIDTAPRRLVQ
jgi:protein-tyrosine phosphatase